MAVMGGAGVDIAQGRVLFRKKNQKTFVCLSGTEFTKIMRLEE
jgi:hypothetical protein